MNSTPTQLFVELKTFGNWIVTERRFSSRARPPSLRHIHSNLAFFRISLTWTISADRRTPATQNKKSISSRQMPFSGIFNAIADKKKQFASNRPINVLKPFEVAGAIQFVGAAFCMGVKPAKWECSFLHCVSEEIEKSN